MNDTNHQQESHPEIIAYASRNNANSLAQQSAIVEEEEEQIVTSTSSDTFSSAARLPHLDTLITSPARITSSTGNDYSSSPQRIPSIRNDITTDVSSEDDSQSPQQSFGGAGLELSAAYCRAATREFVDGGAMPTTSAAAGIATVTPAVGTSSPCAKYIGNSAVTGAAAATTATATSNASINNIRNNKLEHNLHDANMVARETAASSTVGAGGGAEGSNAVANSSSTSAAVGHVAVEQTTNAAENHKIILKLPKPATAGSALNESHAHGAADSNASSCGNVSGMEDKRKVEPLKINLHAHHSPNIVPKITIKPIVKKQNDAVSSDCSSSADDDLVGGAPSTSARLESPIPKLTIKSNSSALESSSGGSGSEPHIVPKLTIRSANEDSTVVPKLTIKISDTQAGSLTSTSQLQSPSTGCQKMASCSTTTDQSPPPPLPKLTIKTSLDGTSESIISTISPALSSSSSSSSSSASASALSTATTSVNFKVTATTSSSTAATIPKLTIKKSADETVPKLTIKTNAAGTCVSTSAETESDCAEESGGSKIPKLTIKTGQEHAVIITQHNDTSNMQTIPKLTIKTKSLEVDESLSDLSEEPTAPPPEKIPKITIKTNETPAEAIAPKFCIKTQHHENDASSIPKLTISVSNLEGSAALQSPKQSPLVVRQLTCSTRKPESPERLPKLMISRQESITHTAMNNSDTTEKLVPKLTIKTNSLEAGESKDKCAKFAIKHNFVEEEKRKKVYELNSQSCPEQQSSEESDEGVSEESSPSSVSAVEPASKVVPKITIKNLSSPRKLKMKSVLEDKPLSISGDTTSKKCNKASEQESGDDLNVTQAGNAEKVSNVAAGCEKPTGVTMLANGESSSSQEFCGFNENTTESNNDAALMAEHVEPRRVSDDMDIDEGLQQHDPQVFNNVSHFSGSNGESYLLHVEPPLSSQMPNVVDMVDLTSSPSPESSPAHFNYTDSDPQIMPEDVQHYQQSHTAQTQLQQPPASCPILMERLQREMSVIQTAPPAAESSNFLLAPLSAAKYTTPPPLQPKPQQHSLQSSNSAKYPQLTERLMANGARVAALGVPPSSNVVTNATVNASTVSNDMLSRPENVIDSIEILDTPEGSPRSMQDENHQQLNNDENDMDMYMQQVGEMEEIMVENSADVLRRNNNVMEVHQHTESRSQLSLKRHVNDVSTLLLENDVREQCVETIPNKVRRIDSESHTMATLTILTNNDHSPNATVITTSPTIIASNHCTEMSAEAVEENVPSNLASPKQSHQEQISQAQQQSTHRSRKQRHEHLLTIPIDEEDPLQLMSNDGVANVPNSYEAVATTETPVTVSKRRGRPKKAPNTAAVSETPASEANELPPNGEDAELTGIQIPTMDRASKSRRVQLLRKRLAIDMVDAEQPAELTIETESVEASAEIETPRRDRALRNVRNSRRSVAAMSTSTEKVKANSETSALKNRKRTSIAANITTAAMTISSNCSTDGMTALNHYGGSNSSLSSACSSSSLSSTTITTAGGVSGATTSLTTTTQIDLTMSSSSSSVSNGSTTTTMTTAAANMSVTAALNRNSNSMLPPTTILSSSDRVPDVVFKPNDFSSLMATQQLRGEAFRGSTEMQQDDDSIVSGADNSGDDSTTSSTSQPTTPCGRGRGRGRGRGGGRGGSVRGTRAHRLGRGASAVAKAIAMNRPRCVGGLKHTPDPERLKGLFSPLPQVFEEDTRMSADLNPSQLEPPPTPIRQPDFLNNEESQSSVVSTNSILDPNTVVGVQNGSAIKRPKKKKMEVCVAEDTEFTVASIAEYEWPPPKGCCPSKNRDTFMIQEQVALYLGIKSFKRKYPDLPRRQIDMEERNWLQEKGLVSEKMCDLGITAVWASDILDIMYADFYDKYEEYKDFIRQKHLREIEAKQKALGLNFSGRGLQARDRAMLSASKWNAYFNKTRKDERVSCMDLQTLTVNVPLPSTAPTTTLVNRPIAEAVAAAAKAESIPEPPTLLRPRITEPPNLQEQSYPLSLVPGQYCSKYRQYKPFELRCFPLNTVLDDPRTLYARLREQALVDAQHIAAEEAAAKISEDAECIMSGGKATTLNVISDGYGGKRVPVRRSRRARTAAAAGRPKPTQCDIIKTEEEEALTIDDMKLEAKKALIANSCCSSSEESSSDNDSDTESVSDSSSSSASSSSSEEEEYTPSTCAVCQRIQNRNLKDLPEVFIRCYTCRRKVHPSCIEMPHRMVGRVRNYNWQCADCKCCIKCKRKQDQNKMLFCEQCDRGFHIYCLGIKTVPDGRWSCERCCVCMRCGATKPEGLPQLQQTLISPNGEKIKQIKHKKVKWINEYRIDHITKLREHCSMLCVPCGRAKTTKRVQIANSNSGCAGVTNMLSPSAVQQQQVKALHQQVPPSTVAVCNSQMSPPPAPVSAHSVANSIHTHPIATTTVISAATNNTAVGVSGMMGTPSATSTATGSLPPPPVVA